MFSYKSQSAKQEKDADLPVTLPATYWVTLQNTRLWAATLFHSSTVKNPSMPDYSVQNDVQSK